MIEVTFTPTVANLTAGQRLSLLNRVLRRSAWKTWFFMAMIGVVISVFVSYISTHTWGSFLRHFLREAPTAISIYTGLMALVVLGIYVCAPLLARRALRNSKILSEQYVMTFTAQGMRAQGQSNSSEVQWGGFIGWSENAQILLLYRNARLFQFIPKRAFATPLDIDQLRVWLIAAGVPRIAPLH